MAAGIDSEDHFDEAPAERAARYWKKAAILYHQACASEASEVRERYVQIAMSWAALATELENAPVAPVRNGEGDRPAH